MVHIVKKISLTLVILTFAALSPGNALANSVEGTVQGLNCVVHDKICPVDAADPHLALENTFVILTGKNTYKLVPNMNRAILSRYLGMEVRVTGDINQKYNSITADKFEVKKNSTYKTVWTQKQQREHYMLQPGGQGSR